jgi:hypothetical protein
LVLVRTEKNLIASFSSIPIDADLDLSVSSRPGEKEKRVQCCGLKLAIIFNAPTRITSAGGGFSVVNEQVLGIGRVSGLTANVFELKPSLGLR